jgi:hypothetical protein
VYRFTAKGSQVLQVPLCSQTNFFQEPLLVFGREEHGPEVPLKFPPVPPIGMVETKPE